MIGKTALHWLFYRLGLHMPDTQTTEAERRLIALYAKNRQTAVEVGVYEGRTTAVIAGSIAENGKVYAVDPFFSGKMGVSYGKMIAIHYLRRMGLLSKIHFLEMLSHEAAPLIREKIDFTFIDGDHSYEGIARDWMDWTAKIPLDGIIALHDTCIAPDMPADRLMGSHLYFRDIIQHDPRFELTEQIDSLSILRKIKD